MQATPPQVNHAVCTLHDNDDSDYVYSLGGYHADDDERTVLQADTHGGPVFRSSPIDVHCLDYGQPVYDVCTFLHENVYMYAYTHVCVTCQQHIYEHACMCVCVCVCVCVCFLCRKQDME